MAARHTYAKTSQGSVTAKSIYVGAEFEANKLCLNKDEGLYVTFNGSTIGHIALKDLFLGEVGEKFFKEGKMHMKFKKAFKVKVISVESTVPLIGTAKQMYDLQLIV